MQSSAHLSIMWGHAVIRNGGTGGLRMCDWPDVVCCGSMLMS